MFKNYLIIAIRHLTKNKMLSFINISGLAFGMSLCLAIIVVIKDQLSYDRFHPHADRTYRINTQAIRKDGSIETYASSPLPLPVELREKYPFVAHAVNLTRGLGGEAQTGSNSINLQGYFTNKDFLDVFGYDLLYGNPSTLFAQRTNIILTQKTSYKLFSSINPVGRTLTIKNLGDFIVSGVLKDPPGKTHLEFDLLGSDDFLSTASTLSHDLPVIDNWLNYYATYTYVTLKDKKDIKNLLQALSSLSEEEYGKVALESRDKRYQFIPQALTKIVPGPILSNNMGRALPVELIWSLAVFSFVIIISAAFNYNSLALAQAVDRAKEIGIRKAAGAQRKQLVFQFLTQSVFMSCISLIVAMGLFHFILIPFFKSFSLFQEFNISFREDKTLLGYFLVFGVVTGLISGILPSLYISSFNVSKSLKNQNVAEIRPRLSLRKGLLVVQFSVALLFVITLINIFRQVNFLRQADYGFRQDDIVNVDLQGNQYALVKHAFETQPDVVKVSGISHSMGTFKDRSIDVRLNPVMEKRPARDYSIDASYLPNLSLSLVAGTNFSDDLPSTKELYVIVNEEFLRFFKLGSPMDAINQHLLLGDSINVSILGVVKDFHFRPFTSRIEPMVLRYNIQQIDELNVQLSRGNEQRAMASLQTAWHNIDKVHPLSYRFFSDELKGSYQFYADIAKFIGLIAFMAVSIACMGLFAFVVFALRRRTKEIGIRKILGATLTQIGILLAGNFAKLLTLACLIGVPLSIFLNGLLFNHFAYRVNLFFGYSAGVLMLCSFALLTIGSQVLNAANTNPVKSLRNE